MARSRPRGWLPSLPILEWGRRYGRDTFAADVIAAAIVTVMLIPQSLAYALLAGLPPEFGLYASVAPLVLYAIFGTSRSLAVGAVAVISLMTAAAIGQHAPPGTAAYASVAVTLAFLSGGMLLALGLLRLGFLSSYLSHPVISGFISASGILIAASQVRTLLGVEAKGHDLLTLATALWRELPNTHALTATLGALVIAFLFWVRQSGQALLLRLGITPRHAELAARAAPAVAVTVTGALAYALDWQAAGVALIGAVPPGLPPLTLPSFDLALWERLAVPALLISIVGFAESVSVGQTLAARRRERIGPDQELVALGASNLGAAFTSGFPVTGGFARSVVNHDAGARTPAAGAFTALGICIASLVLTPALYYLPQATLAATIVVAVLSLVDLATFRRTWRYSKSDFAALAATVAITLSLGVEAGLVAGVALSVALFLYRSSRPHIAVVGLVPGTEHFRNELRHEVLTDPHVLCLRIDESLWFANARVLEDRINEELATRPRLEHVVIQCSAINDIDASALESLEVIDARLREADITLHLSEIKGPVLDRLRGSEFLAHLRGEIFLTQYQALAALAPAVAGRATVGAPEQCRPAPVSR